MQESSLITRIEGERAFRLVHSWAKPWLVREFFYVLAADAGGADGDEVGDAHEEMAVAG